MSAAPIVTAVSAFYNRGRYVPASVGSLLEQSLQEIEIFVVDDGSKDDTATELRKFSDPRLTPMIQENIGLVASLNRAIRSGTGRYVAIHGSGDISLPDRLARQAAYLDANPDVGVTGCLVSSMGRVWGKGIERAPLLDAALKANPFSHGEVMFRRDLYEKVGGYRELFRFAQDRDLWLRIGRHCNYAIVPEVLYERFYLADGVGRNAEKVFLQVKLAHFAVECAEQVDEQGRDLLDRHGSPALLLTRSSRRVADKLAVNAMRWIRDGRVDGARFFARHAWAEGKTFKSLTAAIVGLLAGSPAIARLMRSVFEKLTFVPVADGPPTAQSVTPKAQTDSA